MFRYLIRPHIASSNEDLFHHGDSLAEIEADAERFYFDLKVPGAEIVL
jgi:hypothetical protein